ncbi:MAG: S8 family peptidase [Candidatus Sulfotelmatobacter sp.]
MSQTQETQKPGRDERHSAAWGKRLGILLLVVLTEMAFAQGWNQNAKNLKSFSKFAPDVVARAERSAANQTVRVIVQYKQAPQSAQFGRMQNLGARVGARLNLVKGAAFSIPAGALPALESDPEVVSVTLDHALNAMDDYTDAAMNVSDAWSAGYDGTGIGVAVIDSGINDTHHDLWDSAGKTSRVVYHQDFTGTGSNGNKWDTYGHGTHVAGIIAGNGFKSNGRFAGVAPNASLVDLRVLNSAGAGSDSMVISAIQTAISLKNTYNIKVINLSLGRGISVGYAQDPLCQAVESAWRAGIVVVTAAGNFGRISVNGSNGYGTVAAPGNDPLVLTVGAMKSMGTYSRWDDQIASYSSKGPTTYDHVVKPDLVAPGNLVVSLDAHLSTLETEFPGNEVAGNSTSHDYFTLSGTSMATPAAAGAVTLLLQQNPSLTPDQVKARLMKTAYKNFPTSSTATDPTTGQTFTSYYDLFTVGAGYLDVDAALDNNDLAPASVGSALSPTAAYNSSTGKVTVSNGNSSISSNSVVWGSSIVWGSSVVWGTNVSGNSVVWGTSVVWGSSVTSGFSVVWGTSTDSASSVVWGASLLDGNGAFSDVDSEQ